MWIWVVPFGNRESLVLLAQLLVGNVDHWQVGPEGDSSNVWPPRGLWDPGIVLFPVLYVSFWYHHMYHLPSAALDKSPKHWGFAVSRTVIQNQPFHFITYVPGASYYSNKKVYLLYIICLRFQQFEWKYLNSLILVLDGGRIGHYAMACGPNLYPLIFFLQPSSHTRWKITCLKGSKVSTKE